MSSGEDAGGWGAALIWTVLALTIGVPIWLWTGQELWLIFLMLPGLGFTDAGRGAVWMALAMPSRRGILFAAWSFVLIAVAGTVAVAVWKLHPSGWTWPVAGGAALLAGVVMYLAVAAEVVGGWMLTNGATMYHVDSEIAWDKKHPNDDPARLSTGRTPVVIRAEEIERRRWIAERFDKKFPTLVAKATRPQAKTTTKHLVIEVEKLGQSMKEALALALRAQADGLAQLSRADEAAALRAEADTVAPPA
ncbi:hypothetical protein ACWF9G_11580 [Nocardia sp. NPDC055029]